MSVLETVQETLFQQFLAGSDPSRRLAETQGTQGTQDTTRVEDLAWWKYQRALALWYCEWLDTYYDSGERRFLWRDELTQGFEAANLAEVKDLAQRMRLELPEHDAEEMKPDESSDVHAEAKLQEIPGDSSAVEDDGDWHVAALAAAVDDDSLELWQPDGEGNLTHWAAEVGRLFLWQEHSGVLYEYVPATDTRFVLVHLYSHAMKQKGRSSQVADSSIELEVSLPSGRCETIAVSQSGTCADLKVAAQQLLGHPFLRLAAQDGRILDPANSLQLSGLHDGDSLTAVAQQPKIAATERAFALWCVGGDRIVTWGRSDCGGDSSSVQDQLRNVQQICGTGTAFAAILADGSVVTWGHPNFGGDSSRVQDRLVNVQQISGTGSAFAAILADGTVVTWGNPFCGGDSSSVQDQLRNVQQICGTGHAFAAILADGSVVTWGHPNFGGDSSRVQDRLVNVQQISGTGSAFAAILADGTVATWGDPDHGGDSSSVQDQLRNVQQICGTCSSFAAILAGGSVVTWGSRDHGGDSSRVQNQLRNVQQICGTGHAFAAILADGNVVTWGNPFCGGDSSSVQDQLRNIQQICGTHHAFAAILADGSVVTWGSPDSGGDSSEVQDQFSFARWVARWALQPRLVLSVSAELRVVDGHGVTLGSEVEEPPCWQFSSLQPQHARVFRKGKRWWIEALDDASPSLLNGQRLQLGEPMALLSSALLRLGDVELQLDLPETPGAASATAEATATSAATAPVLQRDFVRREEEPSPQPTGTARAYALNRALRRLVCGSNTQSKALERPDVLAREQRYEDRAEKRRRLHPVEWPQPTAVPATAPPLPTLPASPVEAQKLEMSRRFTEKPGL
eukprot:s47_g15.t1